jgi:hypothetical protein
VEGPVTEHDVEIEPAHALDFMIMRKLRQAIPALFLIFAEPLCAGQTAQQYSSVRIDGERRLHIVLNSGREVIPQMEKDQVSYGKVSISTDHTTLGWLVEYTDPSVAYYKGATIAGELVLFRSGKVFRRFKTDQVFWDWKFLDGGRKVAYAVGPTHGGAAQCILRDAESGAIVQQWTVDRKGAPPEWARSLNY